MKGELQLRHEEGHCVEITTDAGALLWRYVYNPDTPPGESPRPYAHPVCSLDGDVLTNFRPNDHPWHHGLSMTLTSVNGVNFWGGPSYRAVEGYQWREDHGVQRHQAWESLTPARMEEWIGWCDGKSGETMLRERRVLETTLSRDAWSLRWSSELFNTTPHKLLLDNYHSGGGLAGSHYTGLQFRGARDLLDEHGDAAIGVIAEGGRNGETAVHGEPARWMEWACQHDTSLRRTRIRFENPSGPLPWFVRAKNPVAAFAFHREVAQPIGEGHVLRLSHLLTFTRA
jgi:hypothetical protein